MRNRLYASAALVAALALYGCDNPEPAATATRACNCLPAPPPQQNQAYGEYPARLHPRRERHEYEERRYSEYQERSAEEQSYSSSDYQSQSRGYDENESSAEATGSTGGAANVWVDGYGRSHYLAASEADNSAAVVATPPDTEERRAPYRGYDSKCEEKK